MKVRQARVLSITVIALILTVGIQGQSAVAASQGGRCSKVGIVQKTKGVVFTCTRVGNSLKWMRKSGSKTSTPIAAAPSGIEGGHYRVSEGSEESNAYRKTSSR